MNLILQIWHTPAVPTLVAISSIAMKEYAARIGADYAMIHGLQFNLHFSVWAQKLAMLSEDYEPYETVAMIDSDMFPVRGLTDNLFTVPGHGFHQEQAHKRVCSAFPKLTSYDGGFYGGCLYKFNRQERQRLREKIDKTELKQFDSPTGGWDEGMIHRLCLLAKLPVSYFSDVWCYGSHWPAPQIAKMIHVRTKPSKEKLENYRALVTKGIL